jgi:hypothetical protein
VDVSIDVGAGALAVLCPECELGALIIEIGGNLLGAGEAYFGARSASE